MAKAVLVSLLLVASVALPTANAQTKTTMPKAANENVNVLNNAMLLALASNTKDLTMDLLSFLGAESYAAVSQTTAPVEKLFWEQHAEGHKLYKTHAKEHVDKGLKVLSDVYSAAATTMGPVLAQAYALGLQTGENVAMQANTMMDVGVAKLEKAHPARKGSIPKDFGSRVLLLVYLLAVIYICLKVCFFALRKVFGIFCCLFCCMGCRKRNTGSKSKAAAAKAASAKKVPTPAPKKGKK